MKKLFLALIAATLIAPPIFAQVHVKGYVNKNGTYVAPHYRSSPNSTTLDNYSTRGNINPYTGKVGTHDPYSSSSSSFGSPNSLSSPPSYGYGNSYQPSSDDAVSDPE